MPYISEQVAGLRPLHACSRSSGGRLQADERGLETAMSMRFPIEVTFDGETEIPRGYGVLEDPDGDQAGVVARV